MAPTSTSTAARRMATARPSPESDRRTARDAPLRVVRKEHAEPHRRRLATFVPVAMIIAALLVVVVGQAFLAKGQIRMAGIQQQLSAEQGVHRQQELLVSQLETPARIVGAATLQLHMVHPDHVVQLPYVSLTTPLPTPTVTPAPAPPAISSPQTAAP
jgi:hypothetical protein